MLRTAGRFIMAETHGTAYRAPSLTELYLPRNYGNADLRPETSESTELRKYFREILVFGMLCVTFFEVTIDDIDIGYNPATFQSVQVIGQNAPALAKPRV